MSRLPPLVIDNGTGYSKMGSACRLHLDLLHTTDQPISSCHLTMFAVSLETQTLPSSSPPRSRRGVQVEAGAHQVLP